MSRLNASAHERDQWQAPDYGNELFRFHKTQGIS